MLCTICNVREAEIHFEAIVNDKVIKMHLCEECARKKGMELNPLKQNFSLVDLLSTLSDWEIPAHKTVCDVTCPKCGLTYGQFKETGRLSCAHCYTTFALQLAPLLKHIHGSVKHTGKKPDPTPSVHDQMVRLKMELADAVRKEEFERAADLRDQLRDLGN
jgi:protein arginine kinase activator